MRQKIVAGNWKMNKLFHEAEDLVGAIANAIDDNEPDCEVIVCTPSLYLEVAGDYSEESQIRVGAQNVSEHDSGAYTGEISAPMLSSMAIDYCIVGHSERRKYFGESDALLFQKAERLLENDISPIFCIGELLEEREANNHFNVVEEQLNNSVFKFNKDEFSNIILAYEPVWAIGTGKTATPEQAQEMHAFIRGLIAKKYDKETAENTSILYGGSCNAENAKELFSQKDVDGGLIGGASLKAKDFTKIIYSF
ncbi:MAG: triose-phosphate isomerase [Marinilabiliales bacterium]|nr:MAG: triose-phosphate isomerase [Marinilabiliales bacterium]